LTERARLTPAVADTRRAVRDSLSDLTAGDLVIVACSGGADSLALAAAAAFEQNRKDAAGIKVAAVVIEHGLQAITKQVAIDTKAKLEALGIAMVRIETVQVGKVGGTEAAARTARYAAIEQVAHELGAKAVLLGHTLDDQAETVLLGLARGSGAKSLSGMQATNGLYRRPLLGLRRGDTEQACKDQALDYWNDPHNEDVAFSRVRVRKTLLPALEAELGPGVAEALSRTASQAVEDDAELSRQATAMNEKYLKKAATSVSFEVASLQQPLAIRHRMVIQAIQAINAPAISRIHVLAIDGLIDNWHGQKPLTLPGVRVERIERELVFKTTKTLRPGAC